MSKAKSEPPPPQPSIDTKVVAQDNVLVSLVESEHLGPALKAVFESGKEKECVENLKGYIHRKQSEIEDICSFHYQEFIHSVDELLEVRNDTSLLKDSITKLNLELQDSASLIAQKVYNHKLRTNTAYAYFPPMLHHTLLPQYQYAFRHKN